MSELAFNTSGDFFEVPAIVTGWRVRRLKPRGAPELVYGRDGRPLTIPIESDMNDLREAVGGVLGRYRLDPIGDEGKVVDGAPAAYIQVVKPETPVDAPGIAAARSESDSIVRDAMRLNTELAKSVIDRFPEMMHAAAELLRAADGAGLPAREPRATDDDDDDDTDDDEQDQSGPAGGFDLNALVAQVVPLLLMSLGSGKAKMPDLASILDWRKAAPTAKAGKATKPAETVDATGATVPESTPAVLPPIDPSTMAHFVAVQSALTSEESAIAREVAAELSAAELRAWFDELSKLGVPEAVEKVRKLISGFGKTGGAS